MTIGTSSVYAAKSALYTALTTANTNTGLLIAYGQVGTYRPDDIILLGRVSRNVQVARMRGDGGYGWLNEDYTIEVGISTFRGGDDGWAGEGYALSLIDFVEQTVRTDPSLGGTVSMANPAGSELTGTWEDKHMGVLFEGHVLIHCNAVI